MKSIKLILLVTIMFCISSSFGQSRSETREKIKALKVAYLTEQLQLTKQEAEKFWPIYNNYDEKLTQLRINDRYAIKKKIEASGGKENMSEKEAKEITQTILSIEQKSYETLKEFTAKLSEVISYKKILTLQIAEREFNRKMLRKLRTSKKEKP